MLKKTIKHNDFNGNPTETVCYFNLTKAEAIELNIRNDLEVIGQSRDQNEIMDTWRRIIQMSYGKRLGNGDFVKEGFAAFAASEAYSEFFMEIWQDTSVAQEFIRAILPAGIVEPEGQQGSQSDIPAHMANHPSMQSHRAKRPADPQGVPAARYDEVVAPQPVTPADVPSDYAGYLAWKATQDSQAPFTKAAWNDAHATQTPPERVSPPEAPQQFTTPREELI